MTSLKEIKKEFYGFMRKKFNENLADLVSDELYDQVLDDLIVRLVKSVMEDYPAEFKGKKPETTPTKKSKSKLFKRKKSLNKSVTETLSDNEYRGCGFSTMRCGG